ncbi:metallophosphoesterase [Psychrobium sp. nBUS_13]|uniref:metallophosphoesterase n=1 Tax=Psychrobium sp. nBUS_13 TaxID=3395319 RepID=UPI003EBA8C34
MYKLIWQAVVACSLLFCCYCEGRVANQFISKSDDTYQYNDGPYLINAKNKNSPYPLIEHNIINGMHTTHPYQGSIPANQRYVINKSDTFNNVRKIAAISDIHGQFDIFKQLLNKNGVIDDDLNWSFSDGHLVITGDIFDRGDTVTQALWLVYKLEQQANIAGGKVHYLLGNHEYMVLRGDERYIHLKYKYTLSQMNIDLKTLFDETTVLGRWLRSKSTVININKHVFLHGGIHQDFIDLNMPLEQANHIMRSSIGESRTALKAQTPQQTLFGRTGPIWYRGYFIDPMLTQQAVSSVLKALDADRIVVGHTSMEKVETRFDNSIIAIDTSIKNGEKGEVLMIDFTQPKTTFIRGDMNGKKTVLFK